MKNYKKGPFVCSICGKEGALKEFRIEWDKLGRVNFCHNECSEGYNGSTDITSDIAGEFMFSCPDSIYKSLTERYEAFKNQKFLTIRDILF